MYKTNWTLTKDIIILQALVADDGTKDFLLIQATDMASKVIEAETAAQYGVAYVTCV